MEPADVATYKAMAEIFRANGTIKGAVPDSLFNTAIYQKAKQAK
jgi:predicted SAM-dependent methyltransferase